MIRAVKCDNCKKDLRFPQGCKAWDIHITTFSNETCACGKRLDDVKKFSFCSKECCKQWIITVK